LSENKPTPVKSHTGNTPEKVHKKPSKIFFPVSDLRTHSWSCLMLAGDFPPLGRSWQTLNALPTGGALHAAIDTSVHRVVLRLQLWIIPVVIWTVSG